MRFKIKEPLTTIFKGGFLFSAHVALTAYINSSYLTESVGIPEKFVGLLYTGGSILTLIGLSLFPSLIRKYGTRTTLIGLVAGIIFILTGLALSSEHVLVAGLFVLYLALLQFVFYVIDIVIEHFAHIETMGRTRGLYLTTINIAWILAPIIAGTLISSTSLGFRAPYFMALIFVLVMFVVFLRKLHPFRTPAIQKLSLGEMVRKFLGNTNIRSIILANFFLQFFYAWMLIYMPLHLQHMGLSWATIGIIFTLMLIAFPLMQFPLGTLADTKYGEKKMLMGGFLVMGLATFSIAFISTQTWWIWAIVLFATRIGASTIEVLSESYFFKQISAKDVQAISLFRDTQPIAFIIAPLIATLLLSTIGFDVRVLFGILGVFILLGITILVPMKNTK